MTYNPEETPPATEWLAIDEAERIAMVESWRRRGPVCIPVGKTHAIVHMVVENQIAVGESAIVESLARLREEGLSRHDAIHAIGSVLEAHFFRAIQGPPGAVQKTLQEYHECVRRLSAADWLRAGSS